MEVLKQYKASSGKVYDTEVEAEYDDTLKSIRDYITQYSIGPKTKTPEDAINALMEMIETDEDFCDNLAFEMKGLHGLKEMMKHN